MVLETILMPILPPLGYLQPRHVTRRDVLHAVDIMEVMETHGYPALTEEVFLLINHSIKLSSGESSATISSDNPSPDSSIDELVTSNANPSLTTVPRTTFDNNFLDNPQILRLLNRIPIPLSDSAYLTLLSTYAHHSQWSLFWDFWTYLPRLLLPRTAAMYTFLFHTIAETGHQAAAIATLRRCVPEMEYEEQGKDRVELKGALAAAVMDCVEIASPEIRLDVRLDSERENEWVRLWKRCERGLESSKTEGESGSHNERNVDDLERAGKQHWAFKPADAR